MKTTKEKRKQWKKECEEHGCIQDYYLGDEWAKGEFLDLIDDVDELEEALDNNATNLEAWALNLMLWYDDPKIHELANLMLGQAGQAHTVSTSGTG